MPCSPFLHPIVLCEVGALALSFACHSRMSKTATRENRTDAGSPVDSCDAALLQRLALARSELREPVGGVALFQSGGTLWGMYPSDVEVPVGTEVVGTSESALLLRSHKFGEQPAGLLGAWTWQGTNDFAFAYRDVVSVEELERRVAAYAQAPMLETSEIRWLRTMERDGSFTRAIPEAGIQTYISYQGIFFKEVGRCQRSELQRSAEFWARTIAEHAFYFSCKGSFCATPDAELQLEINTKQETVIAVAAPLHTWQVVGDPCGQRLNSSSRHDALNPAVSVPSVSTDCKRVGPPVSLRTDAELCALFRVDFDDDPTDVMRVTRLGALVDGQLDANASWSFLLESRRTGPVLVRSPEQGALLEQPSVRLLRQGDRLSFVEFRGKEFPRRMMTLNFGLVEGRILSDDEWDADLYLATDIDDFVQRKLHLFHPKFSPLRLCQRLRELSLQDDRGVRKSLSQNFKMFVYGDAYHPNLSPVSVMDVSTENFAQTVREAFVQCGSDPSVEDATPGCTDEYCYDESSVPSMTRIWFVDEGGQLKVRLIVRYGGT
jgi:hypothetical protein